MRILFSEINHLIRIYCYSDKHLKDTAVNIAKKLFGKEPPTPEELLKFCESFANEDMSLYE